jgi:hypothetical protein
VSTTTIEQQLSKIRGRIDALQEGAKTSAAEVRPRLERRLAALRRDEAALGADVKKALEDDLTD